MNTPLVSIIIPAYNAARYIIEAVDSALAQTYPSKEIIVINDGSTDGTENVLRPYIDEKQIIYITQENKGLSGARNTGIKEARGDYIAFLDADDIFLPDKIAEQVKHLEDGGVDVSYCGVHHFWDGDPATIFILQYSYPSGTGADMIQKLCAKFFIVPVSVVLKKEVFDRFGYFDEDLRRAEDLDFWLRILRGGTRISFYPKVLAKVRMRKEGNLQSLESLPKVKEAEVFVVRRFRDSLTADEKMAYRIEHYLAVYERNAGLALLVNGDVDGARKYIKAPWIFIFYLIPKSVARSVLGWAYYRRRKKNLKRS